MTNEEVRHKLKYGGVTSGGKRIKHGLYNTPIYKEWLRIKRICYMPSQSAYKYVGGRGIEMHQAWKDDFRIFADWAFEHGYVQGQVIERLDTNEDFKPDNVVFVEPKDRYQYKSNAKMIEYKGETHSLSAWAKTLGISRQALSSRLQRGQSFEQIVKAILEK